MSATVKLTRQGVRDLNKPRNARQRNVQQSCFHDWDWICDDGKWWLGEVGLEYQACTKCGVRRR